MGPSLSITIEKRLNWTPVIVEVSSANKLSAWRVVDKGMAVRWGLKWMSAETKTSENNCDYNC